MMRVVAVNVLFIGFLLTNTITCFACNLNSPLSDANERNSCGIMSAADRETKGNVPVAGITIDNKASFIAAPATWNSVVVAITGITFFGLFVPFLRSRYLRIRPLADYAIAFTGLLIMTPVIFIAGIIIKIVSRGPVFYTQERVGKDGRIFKIIKLRTMRIDAETNGPMWARKNDDRIYPFGRLLRNTHIDEIPQLINVLKGDMSMIGPRPERPFFVNKLKGDINGYHKRLTVKPGITGLAQCLHKYDETIHDVRKKLSYDVLYIKKMCWVLDMKILWQTFRLCLFTRKAH